MPNRDEETTLCVRPAAVRILSDFTMETEEGESFSCTLPATLRSILQAEGKIPDPTLHSSEIPTLPKGEIRFSTAFIADSAVLSFRHAFLKISRVDCVAGIFLNGHCLGRVRNAFLTSCYEITPFLQEGENRLTFVFPSHGESEEYGDLTYCRRPLFDSVYGRDAGILSPVELTFTDSAVITDISVMQDHRGGSVDLSLSVGLRGSHEGVRIVTSLVSPTGRVHYLCLTEEDSRFVGTVTVDSPEYWFPNGCGPQALYRLTVSLYCGNVQVESREQSVGLRDLVFSNPGDPLSVMVNKQSILLIGAGFYPPNPLLARTDPDFVEKLVRQAASAHLNFLRPVSSGGYADEIFYSLCDRYGVLVFQDFPLPNFPVYEKEGAELVLREIENVLPRLSNHPSFAALSFPPDAPRCREDILAMLENSFPDVGILDLSQLSDGMSADYVSSDPGDISPPIKETLDATLTETDKNVFSPAIEALCSSTTKFGKALVSLSEKFRCPSDFDTFAHLFDLSQGENLSRLTEKVRSPGNTRKARMILLRRLNDTALAFSDSLIDCFGRAKPALYMANRFFVPLGAFVREEGNRAVLFVSSLGAKGFFGTVEAILYDRGGNVLRKQEASVSVLSGSAQNAMEIDFSEYARKVGKENLRLFYRLVEEGGMLLSGNVLLSRPKERTPDPIGLSVAVNGIGQEFEITLSSDESVEGLMLSLDGLTCEFDRNCIAVYGATQVKISCHTREKTVASAVLDRLRILGPQPIRLFTVKK